MLCATVREQVADLQGSIDELYRGTFKDVALDVLPEDGGGDTLLERFAGMSEQMFGQLGRDRPKVPRGC